MGNHRFKLSDMMPNAWFYKLKEMGRPKSQTTTQHKLRKRSTTTAPPPPPPPSYQQPSYYFPNSPIHHPKASDTHFPDASPRKSKRKSRRRPPRKSTSSSSSSKLLSSSLSSGCSCRATGSSAWKPDSPPTDYSASLDSPPPESFLDRGGGAATWSSSCSCRVTSSATDIIIDVDSKGSFSKKHGKFDAFNSISELDLPPIVTKPPKFDGFILDVSKNEMERIKVPEDYVELEEKSARGRPVSMKILKEGSLKSPVPVEDRSPAVRRSSVPVSQGLRIRSNSPRIASKKIQSYSRKSVSMSSSKNRRKGLSGSFAVVKSSFDPQRDFRDSMVEMIVENNIRASKDLEDLLACYLSLNSDEYHDTIVKVFEQIWFDLTDIRL